MKNDFKEAPRLLELGKDSITLSAKFNRAL